MVDIVLILIACLLAFIGMRLVYYGLKNLYLIYYGFTSTQEDSNVFREIFFLKKPENNENVEN